MRALIFAVVLVPAMALAQAQEVTEIARCRSIGDDGERLACYDRIADVARQTPPPGGGRGYQAMSLTDVKLDQDTIRDRKVEVSGNLVMMGEMALLRFDATDTSPLMLDFKGVPREQRRLMLERCGMLGCTATVRGRVGRVMHHSGILADSLEIR